MKIAEDLAQEMQKLAPEWNWFCEELKNDPADLISPRTLQVCAQNKATGARTLPVHVSAFPNTKVPQLADFICEVLMIGGLRQQGGTQGLLTESRTG